MWCFNGSGGERCLTRHSNRSNSAGLDRVTKALEYYSMGFTFFNYSVTNYLVALAICLVTCRYVHTCKREHVHIKVYMIRHWFVCFWVFYLFITSQNMLTLKFSEDVVWVHIWGLTPSKENTQPWKPIPLINLKGNSSSSFDCSLSGGCHRDRWLFLPIVCL